MGFYLCWRGGDMKMERLGLSNSCQMMSASHRRQVGDFNMPRAVALKVIAACGANQRPSVVLKKYVPLSIRASDQKIGTTVAVEVSLNTDGHALNDSRARMTVTGTDASGLREKAPCGTTGS